jgi:dolichol-phosphate mannosyltransferase
LHRTRRNGYNEESPLSTRMDARPPHISVVAPAYRCSECIPELCRRLTTVLETIDPNFEIVLVNDASPDRDWEVIQELARADHRIKGVNFSRNFGQHHAITAGVDHASGDWVVVMDCDLQDQPEEIPNLYRAATEDGKDVVFALRKDRQDSRIKILASRSFGFVLSSLSELPINHRVANFSIFSRRVARSYRRLREGSRSHGLTLLWCGFKSGYVEAQHAPRFAGKSTYNLRRSVKLAIESITSQSNKPLRMSIRFGFAMAVLAMGFALYLAVRKLFFDDSVSGWTSTIVSLYFIGGLLIANMGVVGLYLGKVFDETKRRPIYIVADTLNVEDRTEQVEADAARSLAGEDLPGRGSNGTSSNHPMTGQRSGGSAGRGEIHAREVDADLRR